MKGFVFYFGCRAFLCENCNLLFIFPTSLTIRKTSNESLFYPLIAVLASRCFPLLKPLRILSGNWIMIWLIPSHFDIQPFFWSIISWENYCRIFLPILRKQHVNGILPTMFQYFNICFIFTILKHFNENRITLLYPLFSLFKSQIELFFMSFYFFWVFGQNVFMLANALTLFLFTQPNILWTICQSYASAEVVVLEMFCKKVALKTFSKYKGQQL